MKTLPDILFYLSMLLFVALGIYSQFYFLAVLAGGILISILLVKIYASYWNAERVRKQSNDKVSKVLTKKYKAAKNNRSMPFKVGLFIALAAVFSAFTYTSSPTTDDYDPPIDLTEKQEVIEVIREIRFEPPPPPVIIKKVEPQKVPPKVTTSIVIVPDTQPEPRVAPKFITPSTPIESIIQPRKEKTVMIIPKREPPKKAHDPLKIDHMPRFPGCEDDNMSNLELKQCADAALKQFLTRNVRYPYIAREKGIEGRVGISFIITESGEISNVQVVRDPGAALGYYGLGDEVTRVAQKMPQWIPGKQSGKAVKVKFQGTVMFKLQ